MIEKKVKVAIIGAGSAGISAMREVAKVTDDFVLINGGEYGTTCARTGCMPSKIFIQAAHDYYRRHAFRIQGIHGAENLTIDTGELLRHVRRLRDGFVDSMKKVTDDLGDKNIPGYARFIAPNMLAVEDKKIIAERIIIATGSSPIVPPQWKHLEDSLLTTDTFFEQETLPKRMGILGGGIIGLELGHALSRLGVEVSLVEGSDYIGGLTDPVVNKAALETLSAELPIHVGEFADLLNQNGLVTMTLKNRNIQMHKALVAVGRHPNVEELSLDKSGAQLNDKGLPNVDFQTLRIAHTSLFCVGDVNGFRPVLHEAADEGRVAGYNAVCDKPHCFKRRTPLTITFTDPQIVIVGQSFQKLQDTPHSVGEAVFEHLGRARIMQCNKGTIRIYADPQSAQLLGAEMVLPDAEYIGHLLALAIQAHMTVFDVLNMPIYHPTLIEGLKDALKQLAVHVKADNRPLHLAPCEHVPVESFRHTT